MVQSELQMFQQQQKEMLQTHGQSAESTHMNASEALNEATADTGGHQGLQMGQVHMIRRPSNVHGNLGFPSENAAS